MADYPRGVQERGESPVDLTVGQTVTITEYSPDGAGSSNHTYKILKIDDNEATIELVEKPGNPISVKLSYLREHLVRD